MRTLFGFVAALVVAAGCATAKPTTLSASNDSGITVLVVHRGTVVATMAPGFRGKLTDVDGWDYPRTVHLTTQAGTELGDSWDASAGEYNIDMAECGEIFIWVGGPDPSFEPAPSISAAECPSP